MKLAEPEREVVVAIGDGTYLMLNSEIVTAVARGHQDHDRGVRQPRLPVHQGPRLERRRAASSATSCASATAARSRLTGGYIPVDFAKHAESMGALAIYARTEDEIRSAIAAARARDGVDR